MGFLKIFGPAVVSLLADLLWQDGSSDKLSQPLQQLPLITPHAKSLNYQYSFSSDSATWEGAKSACKRMSKTTRLAMLETLEEHKEAVRYVGTEAGTANDYWIGGLWDGKTKRFEWDDKKRTVLNPAWAPWDINQKQRSPDKRHRLVLRMLDRNHGSWISFLKTNKMRYLCETY